MKKILSALIAMSMVFSSIVLPASAEDASVNVVTEFKTDNLIVNGGFEDGFDGWVTDDTGVFQIVEDTFTGLNNVTKNVVNGKKAMRASASNGITAGYAYQEVEVTQNTNYVLSLQWFNLVNNATGNGNIRVYGDSIKDENLLATVGNLFYGEIWYSSTTAFNSGEHDKIIVKFDFSHTKAGIYYCVDNITLKAAGNTQTIGFESGYPEDFNIRSSSFEVSTEKAYEGTHSIKLTSGNGYQLANAAFALKPDRHFAVMFWYYIESGKLGAATKFAHENGWAGYTTSPFANETVTETGVWKRAVLTPNDEVTGSQTNNFIEIAFQNMATNTVVYIDNIQCKYYDESVDSITITGKNKSGGMLHADAAAYNYGYNFEDPVNYQWQKSDDKKVWTDIEGATSEDYRLTAEDSYKYLRVKVNTSNRYSAAVVDSYYSKAVQISEIKDITITEIHVSPNGDDTNDGSLESPLRTLEGAKNYIKTLEMDSLSDDFKVIFHEGKYNFNKSVQFDSEDSGTESVNIVYMAAEGENVVFTGSTEIPSSKLQTVTNGDLLSKLNGSVRGKLVSVKLTECGIDTLPQMNTISLYNELYNGMEYVALYNDGKEQPLAQWPNGEDEYVSWVEATDKGDSLYTNGTKGGTFVYAEDRPSGWTTNVTDIWVAGYPGYNYRYERNSVKSINAETKEISLATQTCFGLINKETKPWKAFNVFEEIDMPGEWYIDRPTMTLYYYSPSKHNEKLELSTLSDAFIKLDGTEYVKFSGITFEKARDNAIITSCIKNVDITGCTFTDIGTDAIYMTGKTTAKTDGSYIDAAKDCTISENTFYNIGGSASIIYGGNVDTLENGNVNFVNNYVFGAATKIKNREMINLYGVGNNISHNNISSSSFQAIRYYGNNHNISNNEIYNVNKASDDAGVIYAGRNYVQRGSVISYNFLHDSNPIRNISRKFNPAIYWDDSQAGQYAHHNIVNGISVGAYACGQDNRLENNIFVDCEQNGIKFMNHYEGSDERKTREQEQYNAIADKDLYNSKYTRLDDGLTSLFFAKNVFNVVKNNLTVNSGTNEIYSNWSSTVSGNTQVTECNDFNAPERLDYRVVTGSSSATGKDILTTAYDIENIGNKTNVFTKNSALAKVIKYGGSVTDEKVILTWSGALGANKYRVVVATDEAMTNKVIDKVSDYTFYDVSNLDTSKEYYWTVYAVNTSREYAGEWQCADSISPLNFTGVEKDFKSVTNFTSENLVVNGGFENGFDGWVLDNPKNYISIVESFTDDVGTTKTVVNGNKALYVSSHKESAETNIGSICQEMDTAANTNYVLNISWYDLYRTYTNIKVYGDSVAEENCVLNGITHPFSGNSWYSSTATFNSGEHEKLILVIEFLSGTTGDRMYAIDNITLKAAGNTQTIGFESGTPEDFNIRGSEYTVTTEKAYEGNHSIKLTSGAGYPVSTVTFALNSGRHYAVMFWYYIESGSLGYASKYAHGNGWSDYTTNPIRTQKLTDKGEWKRAIVTPQDTITGSGNNTFVEVAFQNMEPNSVVYIDNIQCKYYDESVDQITISSENEDGGWLGASAVAYNYGYNFEDPVSYQWQRSADKKTWTDIEGADSEYYMPTSDDADKFLRVKVNTFNRYSASVIDSYYSKAIAVGEAIYDSIYSLTDSMGKKVTDLNEIKDGELNVGFTLKYLKNQKINAYTAVYDENGRLQDADMVTKDAEKNDLGEFQFGLSLPTDKDLSGYTVKSFVWDNSMKTVLGTN